MTTTATTNPLHPGVYRIDLACELAPQFGNWRRRQRGKVHVINLEDGPSGTARITFVVFGRPGAFPFGKLGKPTQGQVVGAMPDWKDVVLFMLSPAAAVTVSLGKQVTDFIADHTEPEFKALGAALLTARANMAIAQAQLEAIKAGTSPNPTAAVHNAMALARLSTEQILAAGGHIPVAFEKRVVNDVLSKLKELEDAIVAAPGKALHALTSFASSAADTFLGPALLELGAILALAAGGAMAFAEKKITPTSRNLLLGGAALGVAAGFGAGINIFGPKA